MAKRKTSVLLPGGIQGLVHDLQNGKNNFAPKVIETTVSDDDDAPEALNEEENPTKSDKDDKNVNSSDTQRVSQHSQASGAEAGKPQEYVVEGGEWSDNQSDRVGGARRSCFDRKGSRFGRRADRWGSCSQIRRK